MHGDMTYTAHAKSGPSLTCIFPPKREQAKADFKVGKVPAELELAAAEELGGGEIDKDSAGVTKGSQEKGASGAPGEGTVVQGGAAEQAAPQAKQVCK